MGKNEIKRKEEEKVGEIMPIFKRLDQRKRSKGMLDKKGGEWEN